jgi:hypothetical protein
MARFLRDVLEIVALSVLLFAVFAFLYVVGTAVTT